VGGYGLIHQAEDGASGELVEHSDGPLGSIKGRALLDYVGDYEFLKKKDCAPCCSMLFVD
jgi:hypothetical protein